MILTAANIRKRAMLRNCCCCCDVKVGATVVAALWILVMILQVIPSIVLIAVSSSVLAAEDDWGDKGDYEYHHGGDSSGSMERHDSEDDNSRCMYIVAVVVLVVALLVKVNMTLSSIGLLFGIKSKTMGLFLWWLVSAAIQIFFDILGMIFVMKMMSRLGGSMAVLMVIMVPAALLIYFYMHSYLCVLSHYKNEKAASVSISFVPDNVKTDTQQLKYAPDGPVFLVPPPPSYPSVFHDTDTVEGV